MVLYLGSYQFDLLALNLSFEKWYIHSKKKWNGTKVITYKMVYSLKKKKEMVYSVFLKKINPFN